MLASAIDGSVGLVFYFSLFVAVGLAFVFVNLLIGRFVRPSDPHEDKLEIYECGEPTIGSSFVQFDLRFYVVALMFIIFDVEVAFLFPWATVFGKANTLERAAASRAVVQVEDYAGIYQEMGLRDAEGDVVGETAAVSATRATAAEAARRMRKLAALEVLVFFAILLVGFAYVWRMGDLDWVRTLPQAGRQASVTGTAEGGGAAAEPVLSA